MTIKNQELSYPYVILFDSSAGSGKTFQLALNYLRLLLSVKDVDFNNKSALKNILKSILCLTFTNPATKEMIDRIIFWMKHIILNTEDGKKFVEELKKNILAEKDNKEKVNIIFSSFSTENISEKLKSFFEGIILPHFDEFRVSTIDSFISMILKAESFRLDISPDFEFNINESFYLKTAIDELIEDVAEDKKIKDVFISFIEKFYNLNSKTTTWNIRNFIEKYIKSIWEYFLNNTSGTKDLTEYFETENVDLDKKQQSLQNDLKEFFEKLKSFEKKVKINQKFFNSIKDIKELDSENILKILKYPEIKLNKNSEELPVYLQNKWKDIFDKSKEFVCLYSKTYYNNILKEILKLFIKKVFEINKLKNMVFLPEVTSILNRLRNENAGFIDEIGLYLSTRFKHYLIDEFQDTSVSQWAVLSFFIEEALSSDGSFFAVGDNKQLIYGWRGSDLNLMPTLSDRFKSATFFKSILSENRRSDEMIVRFNNSIFNREYIKQNLFPCDKNFENLLPFDSRGQTVYKEKNNKGFVTVTEFLEDNKDQNNIENEEEEDKEEDKEKRVLIERIKDKKKYSDICILCRTKREVSIVVRWLLEEKIPVNSDTTVDIRNNDIIREIIALLEWFVNPQYDAAFRYFLLGRIFEENLSFKKEEVRKFCEEYILYISNNKNYKGTLYKAFRDNFNDIWNDFFEDLFIKTGYEPVWEFVIRVFKKWDLLNKFLDYRIYLFKFLDIVINKIGENLKSIVEFFRNEDVKTFLLESAGADDVDAVKVMTVHKAKGLKFPIVFLPFVGGIFESLGKLGRNNMFFKKNNKNTEDDFNVYYITSKMKPLEQLEELQKIYNDSYYRNLIEELNVLYVAFTRAEHELHIFFKTKKLEEKDFRNIILNSDIIKNESKKREEKFFRIYELGKSESNMEYKTVEEKIKEEKEKGINLSWTEHLKKKIFISDQIIGYDKSDIRGSFVHSVLQKIKTKEDLSNWQNIFKSFSKREILSSDTLSEVETILKSAISDSSFINLLLCEEGDVFTEFELCDRFGNVLRPDRVIRKKNEILILDYKTVLSLPEKPDEKHKEQIISYKNLISKIWTGISIRSFICYLSLDHVKSFEVV